MSKLALEIREMLETEARQALTAGWAELRQEDSLTGLGFYLEPVNPEAAPLEVHFDSDQLLVCHPGRHNMVVEFFSEDPEEIGRQVRALAVAVVAGAYGERVKDGTTEVEAEWQGPEGIRRASHRIVRVPGTEAQSWRTVDYVRYF